VHADGSAEVRVVPPRGAHKCKVDDRGRLKLPAEVHRYFIRLDENVVFVTTLDEKTASIYRLEDWRQNEVILANHPDAKAAASMKFRADYYGGDCAIDSQGRIPLPDELRQGLSLDNKEVKVMHFKGHLNIYTLAAAEEALAAARAANLDDVAAALV
jgi:DNA-binding transcriptional regulator/RsmH inhibitor MraZ